MILNTFSSTCQPLVCLLWKNVQPLLLLHYLLTFATELHEILVCFGYQLLMGYVICKVSAIPQVVFEFVGGFLCCSEAV